MSASVQEEFVSALSEASLGALSVFEPDAYRKGSASREPADLAWSSNDAVILLNMQSGGVSQAKHDLHNFRQMAGWMRAWSTGRLLEGHNASRRFSIDFASVKQVLLVSVSGAPDAVLRVLPGLPHLAAEAAAVVSAAASVPESVLMHLARLGGAAIDFVDLLLRCAAEGGEISDATALRYLDENRETSMGRALARAHVERERDLELDNWMYAAFVSGLRKSGAPGADAQFTGHLDVFNDLDWRSRAIIALTAADRFRLVRDVPLGDIGPTMAASALEVHPYIFFISAYDIEKVATFSKQLAEQESAVRTAHPDKVVVGFHAHMVGRPRVEYAAVLLTFSERKQVESATATALNELRTLLEQRTPREAALES